MCKKNGFEFNYQNTTFYVWLFLFEKKKKKETAFFKKKKIKNIPKEKNKIMSLAMKRKRAL